MTYDVPIIPYGGGDAAQFVRRGVSQDEQEMAALRDKVDKIVNDVRLNGDAAVLAYTEKFDNATLSAGDLRVTEAEIRAAYDEVPAAYTDVIRRSISRIRRYHERQIRTGWLEPFEEGELMGQMIRPIASCGVYVPGGTAAYPSSLLMLVVPAKTAGVKRLVMTTPCGRDGRINPSIIVAAAEAGVTEIYRIGGAQAIAAMAFGTDSVPQVDKIVGPGNIYVMLAKRAVYGYVGIDSLAGPSEIVIIADDSADPRHVAADMLSQAEHDERAVSIVITDSKPLAEAVNRELTLQADKLERREIIKGSLENNGCIYTVDNLCDAVMLANVIAPEHLALCVREPLSLLTRVHNAGAVFLGHYTPEPLGDYMAGPSHVLPTESTARFFSPVSVDDFIKKTSVLAFDREAMRRLKSDVMLFAQTEGLTAHANALAVRE